MSNQFKTLLEQKLTELQATKREMDEAVRTAPDDPYAPSVLAAVDQLAALNKYIRRLLDNNQPDGDA